MKQNEFIIYIDMEYNFKKFLIESEEKDNISLTIKKLPEKHQSLLTGFKFKLQSGNTLKGDKESVGMIYQDKITVAAPYYYGREFIILHEIAHLVFEKLVSTQLRKEWSKLLSITKKDQKDNLKKSSQASLEQDDEEIFCMAYASKYAKHPPETFINKKWEDFITNKVPH